jgi:hypothetical protein
MLRKSCLLAVLVAAAVCFSLRHGTAETPPAKDAPFTHVVVFQLKGDAPESEAEALITDAHELLGKIPTLRALRVGRPSAKGSDIAKKDYQVALMILFDDADGLKTYDGHELHQKYVQKHRAFFDQVTVYDFSDQPK